MTNKRSVLLFFVILFSLMSWAQTDQFAEALKMVSDSQDPQQIIAGLQEVRHLLPEQSDSLIGIYYYHLGVGYGMSYQFDSAITAFNRSIEHASLAKDTATLMGTYNGLGNVARMQNNNEFAKDFFETGLTLSGSESLELVRRWKSDLMGSLAGIFFDLGDNNAALKYTKEALVVAESLQDSVKISLNLIRMAYVYNAMDKVEEAFNANIRATRILEAIDHRPMLMYQYYSLGNELITRHEYEEAQSYFEKCLMFSREFDERETIAGSLRSLGEIALQQGELKVAEDYSHQALKAAEYMDMLKYKKEVFDLKYDIAIARKDYRTANSYLLQSHAISDSIKSEETLKSIEEFKIKYETAEKEKKIDSLHYQNQLVQTEISKEKTVRISLIIGIILVLVTALIFYWSQVNQSKLTKRALTAEISELRFQIKEMLGRYGGKIDIDLLTFNEGLVNPLSQREFDVLQQVFLNKSNKEIADDLFLSINTVKTHLKNIYSKLGVTNRKEALKSIIKAQED